MALRELKTIAEVSEETITVRVLRVKLKGRTNQDQGKHLVDAVREDYGEVQVDGLN